jgi:hypothetical protein
VHPTNQGKMTLVLSLANPWICLSQIAISWAVLPFSRKDIVGMYSVFVLKVRFNPP